ncbi:MAG: MgtC/SapB family protein [Deltaproteobacteria bacterium]|nr:MgtC/SapB family protein [Deltaproteobacteria bacterium]
MDWHIPALERLLVALLVGFLVGLDRERSQLRKRRRPFAGVRTFPLIALAGAVPMLVEDRVGPALLVIAFLAVGAVTVISYVRSSSSGHVGATTEMAAIATFLLGVLAGAGELQVAGAAGVAMAVLLVAKPRLEAFSRALTADELASALELAVITVIVLPLVPNTGYGPWEALNPFQIWLVVVLVSTLSFAGFVTVRLLGERRGLLLAGVVGALVSSTAVTVAMARESRAAPRAGRLAAAAAILASAIMCVRVAILVGAVHSAILLYLSPSLILMIAVAGLAAWLTARRDSVETGGRANPPEVSNPFSLASALTFAAIFAVVTLVARAAQVYLGSRGVFVAAIIGSLVDVDAIAIAFAHQSNTTGTAMMAAGIVVAMVTNTLIKLGITLTMGQGVFRRNVSIALVLVMLAGIGAAIFIAQL